jgi:anti-anti-sigma factor
MGTERLVVEFERRTEGGVMLRLSGKLERATAPVLDGVLRSLRGDVGNVVLDLTGVDHIDGRGLELLLEVEADARRTGASIEVTGIRESLRERRPPEP